MTQDLTVLVIGAGANADFRLKEDDYKTKQQEKKESIAMPTGEKLVEKIADWEGCVLPNLVYGYVLGKARELNFSDIAEIESICSFIIKKNGEFNWQNQALPSYQYQEGTGVYLDRKKLFSSIGWEWQYSKFYTSWTSRKIQESESFSWYYKISEIVKHYQPFSIDEMLDSIKVGKIDISKWSDNSEESKKKLIKAGKDLIALFLLQSEDTKVFDYDAICWYRHLRNAVITCGKNKDEIEKKLESFVIISFNYDRSLDYFLRTRVGEFYERIKVIYPYGSLAEKEIWKSGNYEEIGYGVAKNQASFEAKWKNFEKAKILAQDLNVIGELEENEKGISGINEIKNVMAGSKKLYFLGFAFHQENCRIMGILQGKFKQYSISIKQQITDGIFYTNFKNSQKLKISFDAIFNVHMDGAIVTTIGHSSDKGVYDALAQDFDFRI